MEQSNDPGTLIVPPSASLSQAVLEGLQAVAAKPCDESKAHRRELTKRQTTTGWHVRLQCVGCGIGTGPAFKQREHPNWRNYPEYDVDRFPRWHAERRAATKAIIEETHNEQWWAGYDRVLGSPEWKVMRERVMKRANRSCEACLDRPAEEVHHLSYSYGFLPPAYLLVAVCVPCHDRMKAEGDE